MDIRDCLVNIHTDLYRAGYTEDGTEYSAECYYIVVERADGKRLAHPAIFKGCEVVENGEDGFFCFIDKRKEAFKLAETLLHRIDCFGSINESLWNETEPAYGSPYFCKVKGF
jgi:hypothetical protein